MPIALNPFYELRISRIFTVFKGERAEKMQSETFRDRPQNRCCDFVEIVVLNENEACICVHYTAQVDQHDRKRIVYYFFSYKIQAEQRFSGLEICVQYAILVA